MRQRLNVLYRNVAEDYSRTLISTLGHRVHSVVLFGSVARKRAKADSDIDMLVVGKESEMRREVLDIAYEIMERSGFEKFISVVYFTTEEFEELVKLHTPFISRVLEEGLILYDDGIFARGRQAVPYSR